MFIPCEKSSWKQYEEQPKYRKTTSFERPQ